MQMCVSVRDSGYVYCKSFSGDAQNERERTRMIKRQIEEELRQLEDEIAACKQTHTNTQKH